MADYERSIENLFDGTQATLPLVRSTSDPTMAVPVSAENPLHVAVVSGGDAGTGGTTTPAPLTVLSQTPLTVDGTSRALPTPPAGATRAEMQLRTVDAYYRLDGTAVTVGDAAAVLAPATSRIILTSASEIGGFRIIAAAGTGTLSIVFYGGA